MRLSCVLVSGILAVSALPAEAQVPPRGGLRPIDLGKDPAKPSRYVPFPFDADVEGRVNDHLKSLEAMKPFKDLIDKALRDPKKFKLDPETLKKLKLDDPKLQKQVKDWIKEHPVGKEPSPADLKKLKNLIEAPPKVEIAPPTPVAPPHPEPVAPVPLPRDKEEPVRDWLKSTMEKAQDSKMGDWLRDSPAWQKAFEDLQLSLKEPAIDKQGAWGLDKVTGKLFSPDNFKLPDANMLERLGKLKPANLPRWNWTMPALSRPAVPSVSTPAVPSAASLGTIAAWLLAIVMIAVLAWQASRWLKFTRRNGQTSAGGLGPWPVDPQHVSTRAELVRAFDYLALLLLGMHARTWNHRAVARALAERAQAHTNAAGQLAALYEQARYTIGAEALPDADRDVARRALADLAGVATS